MSDDFLEFRKVTYRDGVPRADENAVERLVEPELPNVVEAERLLCDTHAAPSSEHQDPEAVLSVSLMPDLLGYRPPHKQQHGLGRDGETLLHEPEEADTDRLCGNTVDQEAVQVSGAQDQWTAIPTNSRSWCHTRRPRFVVSQ